MFNWIAARVRRQEGVLSDTLGRLQALEKSVAVSPSVGESFHNLVANAVREVLKESSLVSEGRWATIPPTHPRASECVYDVDIFSPRSRRPLPELPSSGPGELKPEGCEIGEVGVGFPVPAGQVLSSLCASAPAWEPCDESPASGADEYNDLDFAFGFNDPSPAERLYNAIDGAHQKLTVDGIQFSDDDLVAEALEQIEEYITGEALLLELIKLANEYVAECDLSWKPSVLNSSCKSGD